MTGEALAGLKITVFPVTTAAEVIPVLMAQAKFQIPMTNPVPRGK
jgi:hypothetical protein